MSIIKKKIEIIPNVDKIIKIPLRNIIDFSGKQDVINNFIYNKENESINDIVDGEKYRYYSSTNYNLRFKFYNTSTSEYGYDLRYINFTDSELDSFNKNILNSFFIVEIFDDYKIETQTRLHIGYYSGSLFLFENIDNREESIDNREESIYTINNNIEFGDYYISNSIFIDNTQLVYIKYSFYNAKTGKIHLFYNEDNEAIQTEKKLYVLATLSNMTKKYSKSGNVNLKELVDTSYTNKINNTINSIDNKKPTYPDGAIFNIDGTYSSA